MPLYEFEGKRPKVGETSFVHPAAVLVGGVTIGENCYIGPGAVLRGDFGYVEIGDGSNVQENAVIHTFPEQTARLAKDSHIGHGAIRPPQAARGRFVDYASHACGFQVLLQRIRLVRWFQHFL